LFISYYNFAATSALLIPWISVVTQVALAVPSMIFIAQAISFAFKSTIFCVAISFN
jgi:hypothetical protein